MNREGLSALLVYAVIAVLTGVVIGLLAWMAWGLWAGIVASLIVTFVVIMLLCSLYTGSRGE